MLERFKIIGLCILAAVVYGEIHDQITARICVEYFNPGHPPIFGGTLNPTLLALGWGAIATWWVGFLLGVPLALCCTVGKWPPIKAQHLVLPLTVTLLVLGGLAFCSGLGGHLAAQRGQYPLDADLNDPNIPLDLRVRFATVHATHLGSYGFGALEGLALCLWAWWRRRRNWRQGRRALTG